MNAPASLPENIRNDIGIYFAPAEKILKALTPFAAGAPGQVWLILTNQSVIFHTREAGKEALVALLSRKDIKEIEYFQKKSGVQLTFIPTRNSQKVSRLNFGPEKQEELEDFCEELADLINFKKETASGIKIYNPPISTATSPSKAGTNRANPTTETELRHATSAIRHTDKSESVTPPKVETSVETKTEVRSAPEPAEVKIAKPSITNTTKTQTVTSQANSGDNGFPASYVIIATLVSLLVAFIWYKFFMIVAGWKEPKRS